MKIMLYGGNDIVGLDRSTIALPFTPVIAGIIAKNVGYYAHCEPALFAGAAISDSATSLRA